MQVLHPHCSLIKHGLIEGCVRLRCCNLLIYSCAPEGHCQAFLIYVPLLLSRFQSLSCIPEVSWKPSTTSSCGGLLLVVKILTPVDGCSELIVAVLRWLMVNNTNISSVSHCKKTEENHQDALNTCASFTFYDTGRPGFPWSQLFPRNR